LNPDFRDMLSALSGEGAEYLLVGAYALAAHGVPRATGDLDVRVRPAPDNARDEAWAARRIVRTEGIDVPVLSREHLLRNKKAVGRPQDPADAARLEGLDPDGAS
jgi:hypothetical protein